MKNQYKIIFMAGVVLLQSACSTYVPRNRSEFISIVKQGKWPTKYENVVVKSDLNSLVSHLQKKSNECLNKVVKRRMSGRYYASSSETYYGAQTRYLAKKKAVFTLQVKHFPGFRNQPKDGVYVMAVDMIALGRATTRLHIYKPTYAFDKIGNTIQQWAMGKEMRCPKLK